MTNNITKANDNKDLSANDRLWLLNLANGRVFSWTALLAVRKGFIDCTQDGQPINPNDVPGDHSWIRQQTKGIADQMRRAGATEFTLADFGRQLTSDAEAKFKSLEYERAKKMQLEHQPSAAQVGASIRIMNKLEASVQRAKDEINEMTVRALMSHGFKRHEAYRRIGV